MDRCDQMKLDDVVSTYRRHNLRQKVVEDTDQSSRLVVNSVLSCCSSILVVFLLQFLISMIFAIIYYFFVIYLLHYFARLCFHFHYFTVLTSNHRISPLNFGHLILGENTHKNTESLTGLSVEYTELCWGPITPQTSFLYFNDIYVSLDQLCVSHAH